MKRSLMLIFIAVALVASPPAAWGGTQPGGEATCKISSSAVSSTGGFSIRSTFVALVTRGIVIPGGTDEVDFVLRMERGGVLAFFRLHLAVTNFTEHTNEMIACLLLDPAQSGGDPAVVALVNAIKTTLGIPANRRLVITDRSITKAESRDADQTIPGSQERMIEKNADGTDRCDNLDVAPAGPSSQDGLWCRILQDDSTSPPTAVFDIHAGSLADVQVFAVE